MTDPHAGFRRQVARCRNLVLPGGRLRLLLGSAPVGWIEPALAGDLLGDHLLDRTADPDVVATDPERLDEAARRLGAAGRFRLRDERFDVRADIDGSVCTTLDRGALPLFGIAATGVHLNGLVHGPDGATLLWVARRAADKLLDPGKLDHLAAGGVPAGLDPRSCLAKEAAEECGLHPHWLNCASEVAVIRYAMARPEGLRRDTLHCYDLWLPTDWRPDPRDGEVESFELWPLARVAETVRDTNDFKFNVNLVLIDLLLRTGTIVDADLRREIDGPQAPGGNGHPSRRRDGDPVRGRAPA